MMGAMSLLLMFSFVLVGLLACPAHASETRSWTGQLNTAGSAGHGVPMGVGVSLKFNSTSPLFSITSETTITGLGYNQSSSAQPPSLVFANSIMRPSGKNGEVGFTGPTHVVLPAPDNAPLPRTFVDVFSPCQLIYAFGKPLDDQAVFRANQVIQVHATVRAELIDVPVVAVGHAVAVPPARTQFFAVELPDDVSEVVFLIASLDRKTSVGSAFASVTIGCGPEAQTVVLSDNNNSNPPSAALDVVVPFAKSGQQFIALEMIDGVPLPQGPSFWLIVKARENNNDDDVLWDKPLWVIGIIVGCGVSVTGLVITATVALVHRALSRKRHYLHINSPTHTAKELDL